MTHNPLDISLFALIQERFGAALTLLRCTKATLVHVSHTIEDLVLTRELPAILLTGFQESSHWREETARYRALADIAQQVCIFAGGPLPAESAANELHITLRGDDPLRQEWFLTVLSPQFAVVLCGKDRALSGTDEALRQFDTLWSFDPTVVNHVLDLLESVIATYRPERLAPLQTARQQYPPTAPDPALVTQFTSEMIRFEEELHQRLQATAQALQDQLRWRETVLMTLIHDLRTPLSVIKGSFDLLDLEALLTPAERQEVRTGGLRGIARLSALITMILDTNRLEAEQFPVEMQYLEIHPWAESLRELFAPLSKAQQLPITVSVHASVSHLWADQALLTRVMENLVMNATKFTPSGGRITCQIGPTHMSDIVEIRVRDTGSGIQPEQVPLVFNHAYQGSLGDQRGLGLGLYFCKLAIEAQGGSITIASQIGVGTAVTVQLASRPKVPHRAR
jgi:signal transduction histidine kinase